MRTRYTIAIDGVVAAGKGTIAQAVAKELGYTYVDTGAMYRAVALYLLRQGVSYEDEGQVIALLPEIELGFVYNPQTEHNDVTLQGENVEASIRTPEVQAIVSQVSMIQPVRDKLIVEQKKLAADGGVVMDGRDMGTVVIPDAELKVFLVADPEVRAARRMLQYQERGIETTVQEQLANIQLRDGQDYFGPGATSRKADDARELDTTDLTKDEQVAIVLGRVAELDS